MAEVIDTKASDAAQSSDKVSVEKPIPEDKYIDLQPNGVKDLVYKWVKREGTTDEKPVTNDKVIVHYVGRLWGGERDGEEFDSSRKREQPFEFDLGKGSVIRGWDVGVATMKRGELAELICRPSCAYGPGGSGKIPPNSTLCFEVELLDFHGEDLSEEKDKSVTKRTLKNGEGYEHPREFAKVTVNITGKVQGASESFDHRQGLEFVLGEGSLSEPVPLVAGLELAIGKMKKAEHARILIKPEHAFGSKGLQRDGVNIQSNATVEYDVELVNFENPKESWELSAEEKIEEARRFKERANGAFVKAHYQAAEKSYKYILKLLENEDVDAEGEQEKNAERRALRLSAHANLAQTYLNLRIEKEVIVHADKALEIDPHHAKALFRKGVALERLEDYENAKNAFKSLLAIEPANRAAQQSLAVCEDRIKKQLSSEKKLYQKLFQQFAAREEDDYDKLERERAEKAKEERAAAEARKAQRKAEKEKMKAQHGDKNCDSCESGEEMES